MLDDGEQWDVYAQVHIYTNYLYWDNMEQYMAAQNRGDDYQPDWQDLAAYLRGES